MRKPLLALALSAFGIGTSEYVIMGLLPDLAQSFHVSIPKAGVLVTGYALSVTFASPIVALAIAHMERKKALLLLMGFFLLGNIACSVAPTYGLFLAARIVTALCHGAFFGTGSIVAMNVVPKEQRTQAVALMFSGLTLANVMGVPAGTALGQLWGWRSSFIALIPIGLAAAFAIYKLVPTQVSEPMQLSREFKTVLKPGVQLVLAMSTITSVSLFCVFTYITPILEDVSRISPTGVTWVLVVFGIGITLGILVGGKLADMHQMRVILFGLLSLVAVMLVLPFAELRPMTAVLAIALWGFVHFAATAPYQARIVEQAKGAPSLASTLNQGAFNLGNALGATAGGILLTRGLGYRWLSIPGAVVACCAIVLAVGAWWLERRDTQLLFES